MAVMLVFLAALESMEGLDGGYVLLGGVGDVLPGGVGDGLLGGVGDGLPGFVGDGLPGGVGDGLPGGEGAELRHARRLLVFAPATHSVSRLFAR